MIYAYVGTSTVQQHHLISRRHERSEEKKLEKRERDAAKLIQYAESSLEKKENSNLYFFHNLELFGK